MDAKTAVAMGLSAVFIVVFLGTIMVPTIYTYSNPVAYTATNGTSLVINNSFESNMSWATLNKRTASGASLLVAHSASSGVANYTALWTTAHTKIGNLTETSPSTITIASTYLTAGDTTTFTWNSTSATVENVTISSANLTYYRIVDSDSWGTAVYTFFVILLPIVLVAGALLFII